jgi:hypothetical protein
LKKWWTNSSSVLIVNGLLYCQMTGLSMEATTGDKRGGDADVAATIP